MERTENRKGKEEKQKIKKWKERTIKNGVEIKRGGKEGWKKRGERRKERGHEWERKKEWENERASKRGGGMREKEDEGKKGERRKKFEFMSNLNK